ncbi:OLEOSIN [Salix viminalis]|uniref:OLEOSIN n=1 Tax=Salix viminalis TaxID=40686 RepID=A0A9Q0NMI4_SALVM|nr:OLEOSIN [Salix viminalis]
MADPSPTHRPTTHNGSALLRKLQAHVGSNPSQLVGLSTLLISGAILLLLTGIAVTGSTLGLILFTPLIIISSPIWAPISVFLFFVVAGFLTFCGLGLAVAAGLSWAYRYFRGLNPPGSDQVDYARSRIYDTASHVKDYAREYGGCLQSKAKDAAPGA